MTTNASFVTESDAQSAQAKIQALYDTMPPAEQKILETIVTMASQGAGDVQGYAQPCCNFNLTLGPGTAAGSPIILTLPQMQVSPSDGNQAAIIRADAQGIAELHGIVLR